MIDFAHFTGKTDPHPVASDLKWEELRKPLKAMGALAAVPKVFGHGGTYSDWRELGNGPTMAGEPGPPADWTGFTKAGGAGNCVWAAAAHEVIEALTDAGMPRQEAIELFDIAVVVGEYAKETGYNPVTGEGDNGTEVRARLVYMQQTGILDTKGERHKIGDFVVLEPGNQEHRLEAAYFFEALPLGVQVGDQQMEAFNAAEANGTTPVWDVGTPEDGHCIPEVGRPDEEHETALTWAKRVWLTEAFLAEQCDEAYAYTSTDRVSKVTGKTYEGQDPATLEEYLSIVGKELVSA